MADNKKFLSRNLPVLDKHYSRHGYEWWWHVFTGFNKESGEEKTFFVEYMLLNPGLYHDKVVLGQRADNLMYSVRPSYVMIKAGAWGEGSKQIHNFYPQKEVVSKRSRLDFQVGSCILTEDRISGSVSVDKEEAVRYPECMSDSGVMVWNLSVDKKIAYSAGFRSSRLFKIFNFFESNWHVQGANAEYFGTVTYNGQQYEVIPQKSFGYADKRWGRHFPKLMLWLSACDLTSMFTGQRLSNACFLVNGTTSRLGIKKGCMLQIFLKLQQNAYEFNSKGLFRRAKITHSFFDEGEIAHWVISAENKNYLLDVSVYCNKTELIRLLHESPSGKIDHPNMFSGGRGYGELKLFKKLNNKGLEVLENVTIGHATCGYSQADEG